MLKVSAALGFNIRHGDDSAVALFFKYCDGKFTDEDLNEAAKAITAEKLKQERAKAKATATAGGS